jgi:hypothetical protein
MLRNLNPTARSAGFRLVAILLLSPAVVAWAAPASATYPSNDLPVYDTQQNQSNWCWAASAQVVIGYMTPEYNQQCNLVKEAKGMAACANDGGTQSNMEYLIDRHLGIGGNWYSGSLSGSTLVADINVGAPIMSWITWTGGGNHIVTVFGYLTVSGVGTYVHYANADGAVGYAAPSKRGSRLVSNFASNTTFRNTSNLSGIRN